MSSFSTRWSVLQTHDVTDADRDADGNVSDAALHRWIDAAGSAYLDQCRGLTAAPAGDIRTGYGTASPPRGVELGRPNQVVVSASATEVFPTSFVIAVRLRALGPESDELLNTARTVELVDPETGAARPIGPELRDELISLEHAARHFN